LNVLAINLCSWQFKLVNGGLTGYSLFFSYIFNLNTGILLLCLNAINITLSFLLGGQKLGFKAVYGFLFTGFMIEFTRHLFQLQQITNATVAQSIIFISLNAIIAGTGVYLCIKNKYSTGSFSTLYLVVNKYFPNLKAPVFLTSLDVVLAFLVLYRYGVFSFLLLVLNSTIFFFVLRYMDKYKINEYITKKMI
jgi:hypothetical protein